jgi:prophage antirepressor-like protein
MDILHAFFLQGVSQQINILWEDEKPLFRANEIAQVLEMRNIQTSILSFQVPRHKVTRIHDSHEVTFLTEPGLYKLLMASRKANAEPFQQWIEDIITKIRETGKYELKLKHTVKNALDEESAKKYAIIEQTKHEVLVDVFHNKNVVYFGKIKTVDDKILIIIGSTKILKEKASDLTNTFGSMFIFKVIECQLHEAFESFLHDHHMISPFKYNEIVRENVFLVTHTDVATILDIAARNIFKFNDMITTDQIIAIETLKLQKIVARTAYVEARTKQECANVIDENASDMGNSSDLGDDDPIAMDHRNTKYTILSMVHSLKLSKV